MEDRILKRLKSYCMEICLIDSLKTYVIDPKHHQDFLNDEELPFSWKRKETTERHIQWLEEARTLSHAELYFAVVYCPHYMENFQWYPTDCYRYEGNFYHVTSRDEWICRECGFINKGIVIMPENELKKSQENVPDFFKKVSCLNCGKPLQNYLVFIETEETEVFEFLYERES